MKKYYTLIPHTLYFILLNLLLVLGCSAQAGADTIIRMTLTGTDCPFAGHADYGVYVPRTESLKGVLILQHGCGMERHGITRPYDLQYQALAKKWRLAVVETALYGDCGKWRDPNAGTAAALLKILSSAGEKTGHPELDAVPWLLFGHSAGGYWTLAMLKDYPERIMAAVCYSPAFDPAWDYPAAAAKIPLLTRHAGAADANDPGIACWATSVHAFQKLRGLDAPASIAHNTGQNHNFSYIRYMAIPFYEAVMKQRMPEGNSTTMRDLDRTQTWLADTLTRQIYRESEYTGNKSGLCVLPDEATARLWKEYVETGTVTDKTPPPAPFNVKATQDGNSFDVTWDAAADIESGILRFEIFKDGTQAGTVPSSGAYQRFDTNGDNTGPAEVPEMKFRITGVAGNAGTIAVRTMNHSNLASEKTELALGCNAQEASAPYNPAALYDERLGNMPAPALQLNGMGAYTAGGLHITGTADVVKLDKFYALAERMVQYRVRLSADARAVFRSSDNGFAAYVDVPNRRVSIATNPVTEETVDFLQGGREYTVEIYHIYQQAKVRIVDVLSGAEAEIIAVNDGSGGVGAGMVNQGFEVGMQYDHYCFGLAAGTSMLVKQIAVYALKGKVKLLLYGDSITQPEAYFPTAGFPQAWTQCIIGRLNGNAMSSGRGGGTIATVLEYIKNELPYIRAQYVMVTIGTNGGNTEANLGELVEYIRAQGAIPILNNIPCNESGTQLTENALIDRVRRKYNLNGCRFDLATSINGDGREVDTSMMYWENYTNGWGEIYHHPNENGGQQMFEQTLQDVPEIY